MNHVTIHSIPLGKRKKKLNFWNQNHINLKKKDFVKKRLMNVVKHILFHFSYTSELL